MALMNELLEEAVGQCTAVSQQVADAAEALNALIDRADRLRDMLASESDQARHLCQDLTARLGEAEHALEGSGKNASSHLEQLETRAGEVQHRVQQLLAAVHKDVSDLESHRDHVVSVVDPQAETAATDLQELGHHLSEVQAAADHHLQEAGQAIQAFSEAVAEAQHEIQERRSDFQTALVEIEEAVAEQVESLSTAVHEALVEQATHLIEGANKMINEHNEAVQAVRHRYAEELKQHIASCAEPLREAVDALGQLCASQEAALKEKSHEVLDRVKQAVGITEEIKPALESAGGLH
ncbi:MAG TPA: hypothetical protein VEQ10_15595 [Vicinamibacteria bacterium]|nr:hypothetical protein [Vicinamibacteria bacterium]